MNSNILNAEQPVSELLFSLSIPFQRTKEREQFVAFMSSTGQATSSTRKFQLIINEALANYKNVTEIDLSTSRFAAMLEQSISLEDILQERLEAFQEYRNGNQELIRRLKPVVKVIQAFSKIIEEAVSSLPPVKVLFVGIVTLLDVRPLTTLFDQFPCDVSVCQAASAVTSSYDALVNLFERLENFLKRLEIHMANPPTPIMTDMIVKIMVVLLSVLALATKQIQQGRLKKFAKKLLFNEKEIETAFQRLDRLTQDEAGAAIVQTLNVVCGIEGGMKEVMKGGKVSMDTMDEMRRDQLRGNIERWLSPPDPSTNHNFFRKVQHSGTAAWFFKTSIFTEWKAKGSLLWIHGKPGAGKSTLLSAIIQDVERMHEAGLATNPTMAYYYFDFQDVKKQDCFGLLSSLIFQLAAKSDSYYTILSKFYSDNTRGLRKPDIDALKECMTNILSLPGQAPIYIIVDALDESPNSPGIPSAREEVLKLIEELVKSELSSLHLCVASRPEIDVQMVLDPLTSLQLSLHDESGHKEDIIAYIKSVVRSDRTMRGWRKEDQNLVIDKISQKADGMFQWVICQVDGLRRCCPANIRGALADLPKSLDETYARALLGIEIQKKEHARRLFKCLSVSIRPLSVEELADILAVQFDATAPLMFNEDWRPPDEKEAVMSACSSLVTIVDREGHQLVRFSHISAMEYLASERLAMAEQHLSYYHILPNRAHTVLAHACLAVLLQLDHKIDKNNIGRFPLASYAARHWVDHVQLRNVSSHIQKAMERLFDPARPHFAAWVWLYDVDRHWIESMSEICPTRPEANPLYYASLCGFHGLVKHLIDTHSPDVNSKGGSHTTALHAAVVKGHSEVASLLLRNGADPNSRDQLGRVPLHRASRAGPTVVVKPSFEIAQFLVRYGADVNITDDQGGTPLHAAARCGDRAIAQLLIESHASLDVRDKNRRTPLHVASSNGKLEVSRLLINCGSDINARDTDHFIPLHTVSRFGHADIVRLLLECSSNVNVRESKRWTPLHYASRKGFIDLARVLIDHGADVDAQEEVGWTALHIASATGDLKIAELLIDNSANVDSRNGKKKTPLDLASGHAKLEMARFLIARGAAVSSRDNRGWTPFHTASCHGHLDVAKFLLEHDIDIDIRTENDETSLYLASSNGKLDVVRFLVKQGANIHALDKARKTAAELASENGPAEVANFVSAYKSDANTVQYGVGEDAKGEAKASLHAAAEEGNIEALRSLLERGADVMGRNASNQTPLDRAACKGNIDIVRLLIKRGADVGSRDTWGWTPLHYASRYGHFEVSRLLIDNGANVNATKNDYWTPIHLSANNGHLRTVQLLLERGANARAMNDQDETPHQLSLQRGYSQIVNLLREHSEQVL